MSMKGITMSTKKKLEESILNEDITFGESGEVLKNHYERHVLAPNEEFNPNNPKFPPMSLTKYLTDCNDLIKKKCSCDFNSNTFGWLQYRPGDRDYTIVKFDKLPSGQYQKVVYEAFATDFRSAFTYCVHRGGMPRIKRQYRELKDNKEWIADLNNQANFTPEELNEFDDREISKLLEII